MLKPGVKGSKLLIIFDLPKTLLLVERTSKVKFFDNRTILEKVKHDDKIDLHQIFWRPGRSDLLDFFFVKNFNYFDVGVWSSLDKEKTGALTKSFFGRHYRNLLFVSGTNREPYEGYKPDYGFEPIEINRDLSQITKQFPQYELNNIAVVSNFLNKDQLYQRTHFIKEIDNDIVLPKYCPLVLGENFTEDITLRSFLKYVSGLGILYNGQKYFINLYERISDIRTAIKGKNYDYLVKRIAFHDQQYREYI